MCRRRHPACLVIRDLSEICAVWQAFRVDGLMFRKQQLVAALMTIHDEENVMTQAKKGDHVKIKYTGTLKDGTVFDTSDGREPLNFILGSGQVIPGFEEAVLGMSQGESKTVTIPVDKAYGPHNEEMVIMAPRAHVPPDIDPQVGQKLELGGPDGELIVVRVVAVTDEHIALDANPPLAGQELNFAIELVEIA